VGRRAAAVSWTSSFTNWALFWPLAESFVARVAIPSCPLCCQCNLTHIDWLCIARGWNIGAAIWDDTISLQDVFHEQIRDEKALGSWICFAVFGVYVQAFYGFLSSWASKKFMSGWWVILRPVILWILALLFKFFLSRERHRSVLFAVISLALIQLPSGPDQAAWFLLCSQMLYKPDLVKVRAWQTCSWIHPRWLEVD
jgi:hypothetical protein